MILRGCSALITLHFSVAAAFFFLAAHAAFIRSDIFLRNAAFCAGEDFFLACLATAGAFAGAILGVSAADGAASFPALTAAQRFFVAAIIALLPTALSLRFTGGLGAAVLAGVETLATGTLSVAAEPRRA